MPENGEGNIFIEKQTTNNVNVMLLVVINTEISCPWCI